VRSVLTTAGMVLAVLAVAVAVVLYPAFWGMP